MPTNSVNLDTVRLVLGVTTAFVIALFIGWPLAYLSAIATCILLSSRKAITFGMSLAVTVIVFLLVNLIYWCFVLLSLYPSTLLLGLFAFSYAIFYRAARGGSKIITLTALLALLLISTGQQFASDIAWLMTKWLPINVFVGFITANVFLWLFPLSDTAVDDVIKHPSSLAHSRALELSIAVGSFVTVFWFFAWFDILMLVFLSLFTHRLVECTSLRRQVTLGYFLANLVGGAFAVVSFELLVIATNPLFIILLSLTVLSILTLRAFESLQHTTLSFTSINSFIALMGTAILYNFEQNNVAYLDRLSQIAVIAMYLLTFFKLYQMLPFASATPLKNNGQ